MASQKCDYSGTPKVDENIFDSALSHTRGSDASQKKKKILASTFGQIGLWTSFESSPVSVKVINFELLFRSMYYIIIMNNIIYNFGFKNWLMVTSIYRINGVYFDTLRERFPWNPCARRNAHLRVTFLNARVIADSDANLIERVLYQQKVKNDNGRLVKRLALSGKKNANYYLFYRVKTLRQRHQASFNYNFGIMVRFQRVVHHVIFSTLIAWWNS